MVPELFAVFFVLHLIVAFLVYQNAQQNSPQSAFLWALVALVAGFLLGVLLYVLLGRDASAASSRRRPRGHSRASTADTDEEPMNVDDSGPFYSETFCSIQSPTLRSRPLPMAPTS